MIKNMMNDLKIAAMDIASEVKDVAHDAMTVLPDEKPIQFNDESKMQSINAGGMEYMNAGWGMQASAMTATQIDMIADKINFVSDMIAQGLIAFDAVENELVALSRGNIPPQPAQLQAIAGRVDANQKQIFMGLQKLKELSKEVDRATDKLQQGNAAQGGWGNKTSSVW